MSCAEFLLWKTTTIVHQIQQDFCRQLRGGQPDGDGLDNGVVRGADVVCCLEEPCHLCLEMLPARDHAKDRFGDDQFKP